MLRLTPSDRDVSSRFQPVASTASITCRKLISVGGMARVKLNAPPFALSDRFEFELSDPPEGIAVEKASRVERGVALLLRGDAEKAKPGLKGNLIGTAFQKTTSTGKDGKPRDSRWTIGVLPAIPFEVVKP